MGFEGELCPSQTSHHREIVSNMETPWLPKIDAMQCSRCGQCVTICPQAALRLTDQGVSFADPAACTYCGLCETACPRQAVVLEYAIVWEEKAR